MNKLLKQTKHFLKKNNSTILSGIAVVGLIATAISSAKATPKALKLIKEFKESNASYKVSKIDMIKISYKEYIPTIIIGTATITCIIFSNKINIERQKNLISAYILLNQSFDRYKSKIKEIYGNDIDRKINYEIIKEDKLHDQCFIISNSDDKIIFFMDYYDRFFERSILEVREAEYQLNKRLIEHGEVSLNYFLKWLDLPETKEGNILGWTQDETFDFYNRTWIDFSHEQIKTEDDLECIYIKMITPPMPGFDAPF